MDLKKKNGPYTYMILFHLLIKGKRGFFASLVKVIDVWDICDFYKAKSWMPKLKYKKECKLGTSSIYKSLSYAKKTWDNVKTCSFNYLRRESEIRPSCRSTLSVSPSVYMSVRSYTISNCVFHVLFLFSTISDFWFVVRPQWRGLTFMSISELSDGNMHFWKCAVIFSTFIYEYLSWTGIK